MEEEDGIHMEDIDLIISEEEEEEEREEKEREKRYRRLGIPLTYKDTSIPSWETTGTAEDQEVKEINCKIDRLDMIHYTQRSATPRPKRNYTMMRQGIEKESTTQLKTTTLAWKQEHQKIQQAQSPTTEGKLNTMIVVNMKQETSKKWYQHEDIIKRIAAPLDAKSILACSQVCRSWRKYMDNEEAWEERIERDFGISDITGFKQKRIYFMEQRRMSRQTQRWRQTLT